MAIRVAVAGAAGKMGLATCEAVDGADDLELVARVDPALGVTLDEVLGDVDVVVDFTRPDVALDNINACMAAGVHAVVGTSGFDISQVTPANGAKLLFCPNFAIGAVLMMKFAAEASKHMPKVEIVEYHHDAKLDAPSGTAKRTVELIREASGKVVGGVHSVRLPGVIANQEVIFGEQGQTLTIRHDTTDRKSFMPGVLLAVRKVASMDRDVVVGLEHVLD